METLTMMESIITLVYALFILYLVHQVFLIAKLYRQIKAFEKKQKNRKRKRALTPQRKSKSKIV